MHATANSHLEPSTRLQFLAGIGPGRARLFEKLELHTLEQLVRHYPRTWLDARRFVKIAGLTPGGMMTVRGTVRSGAALRTRGGRTDFSAVVEDDSGRVGCYFFGQPFLARTLVPGVKVVVSGELDAPGGRFMNPMFEVLDGETEELLHVGRLVPVHALTRGLSARAMRRAVRLALDAVADRLPDALPRAVADANRLGPLGEALEHIHFPPTDEAREQARRRLAFEELFVLQAALALRRRALAETGRGLAHRSAGTLAARAIAALPFELTADQRRSLDEITADLAAPRPMHRMLLGDVGSGKTVVAALAALHVIEAGRTAAFLAPTEILARQHARTLESIVTPAGAASVVLTGASTAAERRQVQRRLDAGEPMLVIGTHALLEEKVRMPALGLAIVDEQHRFGVRQRASLAAKSELPDVLVLTATPIPRTLVLAGYGDLDVSRLAARPLGRGRRVTRLAGEEKRPQVIEFMAKELAAGRQAFVVVPLVEDGSASSLRDVEAESAQLASHPLLHRFRVALLHGRMKAEDKQAVMKDFAGGRIHVLVATTVVEVGVDVPNAALMVIENAERFGLTQLHQLRGRVGRGEHRSVCVLMPGHAAGPTALQRLEVLVATDDGFAIAEKDLELRGPGEVWGTKQSGLPRFRMADPARDEALLVEANRQARGLVEADPWLRDPANTGLRGALERDYHEAVELAPAG